MTNPWNLTARESEVLRRLTESGCAKVVASEMGISICTVSALVRRAMSRMGQRVRTMAILSYDRWAREQGERR